MQVSMTVNGREVSADIEPRMLLVHFIRDTLRLTAPAPGPQPVGPVPGLDGTPAAVLTIAPR